MTALLGTRNGKSCGSKVACDGHAAFGLPQTVKRLAVLRCASAAETRIKNALAASMTVSNTLDLIMRFSTEIRGRRSEVIDQMSDVRCQTGRVQRITSPGHYLRSHTAVGFLTSDL